MATDLATLAIRVENGDVVKATTALNSLTVAGGKSEAATQRLTRRMALLEIEARNVDAAMGKISFGMSKVQAVAASLAAVFAGYKLTQFATETLGVAARYETLGVAMDVVGKSAGVNAGRMAALQAEMQKTGISAIESRLSLTRLAQAHIDLGSATKLARIAQDAAVIGNVNSSEALGTLIHGIQSAQTDVLRTIGINVSFENSYKTLATQLHTTSDALTEVQKTQARVGAVMEAGKNIAGTYEAAMGTVGKQLTSTTRYLEDMRVKVGTAFLPEYATTVKAYADALKLLSDNAPAVIGAVAGITTAVTALTLLLKGSAIATGVGAIAAAIAAIGASPIIVATAALAALGVVVGSFATDAALARREAAEFTETLKHLPDAALARNIDRTALAVAELNAEIAQSGAPTKYQSERLAELTEKLKQYTAARTANAAAKTAGDANAAAAAAEAARAEAAKRAAEAAKQAKKDAEELRKATDAYYNSLNQHQIDAIKSIGTMREQNAATREMIAATLEGPAAVDALTVAQAGANAVRELGVGVSEKVAAAVRREAEEQARLAIQLGHVKDAQREAEAAAKKAADEAARDMERRARELQRATTNAIEQGLTDVVNGKNPLIALVDGFKRAFIRALSEALAERALASKFAAMLGVGTSRSALAQAGMVALPGIGAVPTAANGGIADASTVFRPVSAGQTALGYGALGVGAITAGYGAGQSLYSTSHGAAGNYARGGIGGAAGGALAGAAIGTAFGGIGAVPGAIIGGIVGLTAGLFGMGAAAKASAVQVREMRAALAATMEGLRAEVGKDALASTIAQVHAQSAQIRQQIEDAYSGGGANSDTVRERNKLLTEAIALEAERIRQLKEEADVLQARSIEDYQARRDAAIPGNEANEARDAEFRRIDREREDLIRSFGSEIDEREKAVLAMADQAFAAEKQKAATEAVTGALNGLVNATRNAPSGFFVEKYLSDFAVRAPRPIGIAPPSRPNFSTSASVTSASPAAPAVVMTGPISVTVYESKNPDETADAVLKVFRKRTDEILGSGGRIVNALGRM